MPELDLSEAAALALDRADPLAGFRAHFYVPPGIVYMDGNSLGLLSREAEAAVLQALDEWKRLGIDGWLQGSPPWYYLGEELGRLEAPLVGALPEEVVVTGSTTINLHTLVATFYRPQGRKRKIVALALDFPSDLYALQAQVRLHGGDPSSDLRLVTSRDGRTIAEEDVIAALTDEVALLVVSAVLYRSGQLLDLARLTAEAHQRDILIGIDCCHSIGAIPHHFSTWGVDFGFWCNYKYLNAGPGSSAGLYVNRRHFGVAPGLIGWWGSNKARQFDLAPTFDGASSAGAWQIGTPPILSTAPLRGALVLQHQAGIENIRAKSLAQTSYLMELLEGTGLTTPGYGVSIGTPRNPNRRGGHVAIEHVEAARLCKALKQRGVIPDFRPPQIIRLAPIALYTSYHDIWVTVQTLKELLEQRTYEHFPPGRDVVG